MSFEVVFSNNKSTSLSNLTPQGFNIPLIPILIECLHPSKQSFLYLHWEFGHKFILPAVFIS